MVVFAECTIVSRVRLADTNASAGYGDLGYFLFLPFASAREDRVLVWRLRCAVLSTEGRGDTGEVSLLLVGSFAFSDVMTACFTVALYLTSTGATSCESLGGEFTSGGDLEPPLLCVSDDRDWWLLSSPDDSRRLIKERLVSVDFSFELPRNDVIDLARLRTTRVEPVVVEEVGVSFRLDVASEL